MLCATVASNDGLFRKAARIDVCDAEHVRFKATAERGSSHRTMHSNKSAQPRTVSISIRSLSHLKLGVLRVTLQQSVKAC